MFKKSLFIFRRDLRLEDNTGLIFALKSSETVIPAFIFTPEQIDRNPYRSDHCLKFMIESLEDLESQIKQKGGKLYFFKGRSEEVLERCIKELNIDAIIVNRDYTPYSVQRDKKLEKVSKTHHIPFYSFDDALLHPPEETVKRDGKPYLIFTPYFQNASMLKVMPPTANRKTNYFKKSIPFAAKLLPKPKVTNTLKGGRTEGLKALKRSGHFSPYLKFTVISPREVYKAIDPKLVRSLYWRDFFTMIAFFFPHVFKGSFHPKYDNLKWSYDKKAFQRWCNGTTGFPIVDAGMREMNETGFMSNRARMITASFLIKDLHIDWRWGEKYFAQTLVDYDPALNNGNWQWVASTGADAQPYFRILNPWNQQKKFDRECLYIKQWIPELRDLPPKIIHKWYDETCRALCPKYPAPMLDHATEAKTSLLWYHDIKRRIKPIKQRSKY